MLISCQKYTQFSDSLQSAAAIPVWLDQRSPRIEQAIESPRATGLALSIRTQTTIVRDKQ